MRKFKLLSIFAIAAAISACNSTSSETNADAHDTTTCTEHDHGHGHGPDHGHAHGEECNGHNHENIVVGIAQKGDYKSGKISIKTLNGESKEFDYSKSNQDKIAAWQAGDTVSIFIDHHHHGEKAHDSITAVKIGQVSNAPANHSDDCKGHDHENCEEHDHHDHGHNH